MYIVEAFLYRHKQLFPHTKCLEQKFHPEVLPNLYHVLGIAVVEKSSLPRSVGWMIKIDAYDDGAVAYSSFSPEMVKLTVKMMRMVLSQK